MLHCRVAFLKSFLTSVSGLGFLPWVSSVAAGLGGQNKASRVIVFSSQRKHSWRTFFYATFFSVCILFERQRQWQIFRHAPEAGKLLAWVVGPQVLESSLTVSQRCSLAESQNWEQKQALHLGTSVGNTGSPTSISTAESKADPMLLRCLPFFHSELGCDSPKSLSPHPSPCTNQWQCLQLAYFKP